MRSNNNNNIIDENIIKTFESESAARVALFVIPSSVKYFNANIIVILVVLQAKKPVVGERDENTDN